MKTSTPQVTLRNLPDPVNRYLRKRAQANGKSLNQTIIDELSERAGVTKNGQKQTVLESLAWFIGSGTMDEATLRALEEDDKDQKAMAARELQKIEDLGF